MKLHLYEQFDREFIIYKKIQNLYELKSTLILKQKL